MTTLLTKKETGKTKMITKQLLLKTLRDSPEGTTIKDYQELRDYVCRSIGLDPSLSSHTMRVARLPLDMLTDAKLIGELERVGLPTRRKR